MQSATFGLIFIINIHLIIALPTHNIEDGSTLNDRPIIGILMQEIPDEMVTEEYRGKYDNYIAASYVKFVESAGARVVPVWTGRQENYYEDILSKINGVLFPGGDADFNNTGGYADAGEFIYKIATRYNENGNYFPIWGTCLGFDLLTYLAANRFEHRISCQSEIEPLPLQFTEDFKNSRLFRNAPADIINILRNENVTGNYHYQCITKEGLIKANLTNKFRVMSIDYDLNNIQFISSLEHVTLPFYGVQFHPERNNFEWIKGRKIPHTYNAIRVSNYFADFFVNEARKNNQKFLRNQEENEALIYNFSPRFDAGSIFIQVYIFKANNTIQQKIDYTVTQITKNTLNVL